MQHGIAEHHPDAEQGDAGQPPCQRGTEFPRLGESAREAETPGGGGEYSDGDVRGSL